MKTGFYGWKLLLAFWVILAVNLAFPFYGASVINTYMAGDFKMDRQLLGLIFTVFMLTSGVITLVASYFPPIPTSSTWKSASFRSK